MASSRFFATGDSSDDSDVSRSSSDDEVEMSTQLGGAGQVKLVYSSSEVRNERERERGKGEVASGVERILTGARLCSVSTSLSHHIFITRIHLRMRTNHIILIGDLFICIIVIRRIFSPSYSIRFHLSSRKRRSVLFGVRRIKSSITFK